jgi:hypothetical protein
MVSACYGAKMDNGEPQIPGHDWFLGERVIYRQFTCARCGEPCMTTTTEAEANREYLESGQTATAGISSVCDDCYEYLITRAKADGLIP